MRTKVQDYFVRFIGQVTERKFLLYWFTKIVNFPSLDETFNREELTVKISPKVDIGDIFQMIEGKDKFFYIVVNKTGDVAKLELMGKNFTTPLLLIRNDIELKPGEMVNFKGPKPIITSPGIMILNQRIFVESMGDAIPYWEEDITPGKIDKVLPDLILSGKITSAQGNDCLTNSYDIGYFAELCNKSFTSKTFTTRPDMGKIRDAKIAALTTEQRNDPIALAKLEDELLALDKEWLKDDDADVFHSAVGGKSYGVHRKKMLITVGAIPSFTDKGEASISLVENALTDGLRKENFPAYVNEVYKGSYDRGAETAKGGELTKYVLRIFQDLKIVELDCGVKKGVQIELVVNPDSEQNKLLIGRNLVKTNKPIDASIIKQEAGKVIEVRDPSCCKTKNGLCYKCMGINFEKINETDIGSYILDISSGIMMIAMKNMHGTKLKTMDVNFEDYLITV